MPILRQCWAIISACFGQSRKAFTASPYPETLATLPNKKQRFFNGYVTAFSQRGWLQRSFEYHAIVRPWYWLLTRTADCQIYQELTVPQIFEEVLKQYGGIADYELRLKGKYQPRQ